MCWLKALDYFSTIHPRKLFDLCVSFLLEGSSFPFNPLHCTPRPPLVFATRPYLASTFGISTPPHLPATLPPNTDPKPINLTHSVISLSSQPITASKTSVISKGLSFSLKSCFDNSPFLLMLPPLSAAYARNTFGPNTPILNTTPTLSIPVSPGSENPAKADQPKLPSSHPLKLYISHILSIVSQQNFTKSLPSSSNLIPLECQALHSLRSNPHILILPADKGSTTVVLNKVDYLADRWSHPGSLLP